MVRLEDAQGAATVLGGNTVKERLQASRVMLVYELEIFDEEAYYEYIEDIIIHSRKKNSDPDRIKLLSVENLQAEDGIISVVFIRVDTTQPMCIRSPERAFTFEGVEPIVKTFKNSVQMTKAIIEVMKINGTWAALSDIYKKITQDEDEIENMDLAEIDEVLKCYRGEDEIELEEDELNERLKAIDEAIQKEKEETERMKEDLMKFRKEY